MQESLALALLLALPAAASIGGFQVASGTFVTGTTTGNKSVTSLPFTPKAVIFWHNGQVADNASLVVAQMALGAAVSSSARGMAHTRRNSAGTQTFSRHSAATTGITMDSAGVTGFEMDFVSMNSNGFTINVISTPAFDFYLHWMALGGGEFRANLVQFNSPTTAISQAFTGMGFKPDALFIFSGGMTAAIPTTDGNSRLSFGFVDASLNQAGLGIKQVDTTNTSRRSQSTASAIYIPDTSTMWLTGTVTALGADGATINYTVVQASTVKLWALGLAGVRATVASVNQATSTGAQPITTLGHTPTAVLMGSFCRASGTGQQNDGTLSIGGATTSAQGNNAIAQTQGTNSTGQSNYSNQLLSCLTGGTPTIDSQASFTSFDSTGFSINNGTADATARQLIYMTFAPLPVNRLLIYQ